MIAEDLELDRFLSEKREGVKIGWQHRNERAQVGHACEQLILIFQGVQEFFPLEP